MYSESFPNQIEHTLQWAREWFEEIYTQTPEDVNRYITSGGYEQFNLHLAIQQNMKFDTLTRVKESLVDEKPSCYGDCVAWARIRFEEMFCNRIKQLLHNYPVDRMTSTGTLFWSGAKKPPSPIEFDITDSLHREFIVAVRTYGLTYDFS